MKRLFGFLFLTGLIVLLSQSCQKELSLEVGKNVSEGSLQSGSTGDCLPKTVAGAYEKGTPLDGSVNYIEVQVDVTKPGSYIIYTDTINGIYFRATGIFTTTGLTTVKLKGTGTPLNNGISNFVVTYGTSECLISVTILPSGSSGPAVFSLIGSPGTCMNAALSGDYIAGVPLTSSNFVVINVNVTAIGTYNITTSTSNGIVFSGTGTLGTLGAQTITLTASGTPIATGSTNIPVTAGSSTCSFVVDVVAAATAGDYFPRTANSNWSYEYDGNSNDTVLLVATPDIKTVSGNPFTIFAGTTDVSQGFDSAGYYRKSGGSYYRWQNLSDYLFFDNEQFAEFIFLKDDQPVGHTWYSSTSGHTGTIGGTAITIRIKYTILQKNVSKTVKGTTYPNTIVVEEKYEANVGGTWQDMTSVFGSYKDYYSKNIGWILDEYFDQGSTNPDGTIEMRRYSVF